MLPKAESSDHIAAWAGPAVPRAPTLPKAVSSEFLAGGWAGLTPRAEPGELPVLARPLGRLGPGDVCDPLPDCSGRDPEEGAFRITVITWNVGTAMPPSDVTSLLHLNTGETNDVDMIAIGTCTFLLRLQEVNSKINKRLKDALFTDQWSELFMDVLSPFHFILVRSWQLVFFLPARQVRHKDKRAGLQDGGRLSTILLQPLLPFQVSTVRMQGVILLVFAKYYHLPFLHDIQTDCTRTGLGGYWGNKGGVSVRLSIFGHMVCFLNCHLPAHLEKAEQRKEDFATILHMQQFEGPMANGILDHECPQPVALATIHSLVFWFGDLNFRIESLDICFVKYAIDSNVLSQLWEKDQLNIAKSTWPVLRGFQEGPLNFPPTFKFDVGTNKYDSRLDWDVMAMLVPAQVCRCSCAECQDELHPLPTHAVVPGGGSLGQSPLPLPGKRCPSVPCSAKKRKPAWTDRILWKIKSPSKGLSTGGHQPSQGVLSVSQLCYCSHMEYTVSDHKPVAAIFAVQFASKVDKPLVEIYVADEWSRPEQAVVRYKMAVGFHRSSWDWIGLYRVGAWGLLGLEGVGSTAQHCGVLSELPPTSEHGEGIELCPPFPWHHDVVLLQEAQVGFRHPKDYVSYVWARSDDGERCLEKQLYAQVSLGQAHGVGSRDLLGGGGALLGQPQCSPGISGMQVMFSEEALPKGNGEYILGYYSNTSSSIAGVTEPFQISLPRSEEGSSSTDSSGSSSEEDDSTLVLLAPKSRSPSPGKMKRHRSRSPSLAKFQGLILRPSSRDRGTSRSPSPQSRCSLPRSIPTIHLPQEELGHPGVKSKELKQAAESPEGSSFYQTLEEQGGLQRVSADSSLARADPRNLGLLPALRLEMIDQALGLRRENADQGYYPCQRMSPTSPPGCGTSPEGYSPQELDRHSCAMGR
ncbi:hypothetical protein Nmel_015680 [Mimus melanotis]